MKFIDIAIPDTDGEDDKDGALTPIATTPTAKTFGRRPVEEYTLNPKDHKSDDNKDHRSDASQADTSIDGQGNDDFFDANDDQTDVSHLLRES